MHFAPEDVAVEAWNGLTNAQRLYYPNPWYGRCVLSAVLRRGPAFVPGLLQLVQLSATGADRMRIDLIGSALLGFDGSAIADTWLDKLEGKQLRVVADAWAQRYPETMAERAIPRALAGGKAAANAVAMLRRMILKGKGEAVSQVAARYAKQKREVVAALEAVVGSDPTAYVPEKLPKLPDFFQPRLLPQLALREGGDVPAEAAQHVGTMLAMSEPDAPYAGVAQVRQACTSESCREFSWGLFEAWMAVGSPPKEMWAMHALGWLGDDETARRLTPLIRAWPGERAAARAVEALGVLAALGTDLSLMLLSGIADKVRFASIQEGAQERIAQIAQARGLSPEELADRLVPDLGLDARGELELDFGARRFKVSLDERLDLVVADAEGKALAALPKPAKSDDAAQAKAATETFKALKKDVAAIARSRIDRLQTAMIARRRWSPEEHRLLFVDKPLVLQLSRRLVWGAYDAKGRLTAAFRVDVDRTFADEKDQAFQVPAGATVGVVHPLELDEKQRTAWSSLFADYHLLQPFEQLARQMPCASAKEVAPALKALEGLELPAPKLVFGLEKLGWKRGAASDGGAFGCHFRDFSGVPLSARVDYSGAVGMGYIEEKELLTLSGVQLLEGEKPVAPEKADLAAVNEVVRELRSLASS
ncbi:MAG: DUF4132 domain-containing protein [Myxococcales bacterium]